MEQANASASAPASDGPSPLPAAPRGFAPCSDEPRDPPLPAIAVGRASLARRGGRDARSSYPLKMRSWSSTDARWLIPLIILTGGAILAVLHHWAADEGLIEQVSDAAHPARLHAPHRLHGAAAWWPWALAERSDPRPA
ncbi:hypothetical protein QJS66_15235 [Kocuria rhizophila]|nr:hypothetical protein QJS66_15235 [Kocuria rhizophila]